MIDTVLVQKLIEEEIHPDYTIGEFYDTPEYIFISRKHKEYHYDDERCFLLGVGMIVYDKNKNEYRVMGSGESWHYDMLKSYRVEDPDRKRKAEIMDNYFDSILPSESDRVWVINYIKEGILRRNRINTGDIEQLCIITGAKVAPWTEDVFDIHCLPDLEREDHNLVTFDNKKAREELMEIWDGLGFGYEVISETELVLWKVKPAPNMGFVASVAGRKKNRQFCKAKLQFGQDKQL